MVFETRWDFFRPHVENKHVLDIGPAELVGTINQHKFERWIHHRLADAAASLIGLEKNAEQVQALVRKGFDIREGDAEEFRIGVNFDIVVAGELIEHLSNPGRFLNCARQHLVKDGKLLLTTPNRFSILALDRVIRTGNVPTYTKPIAKHVAFFDEDSLTSLLNRHGFGRVQVDYCKWVGLPATSKWERWLVGLVSRYRPALLPVLLAVAQE